MDAALYWTIWIALALFALGETGKRGLAAGRGAASWAWPVSAIGAAMGAIHLLMAMGTRHAWSHESAMIATALQTEAVYGLRWGGGVFVNYAFVGAWIAELAVWRMAPARYASAGRALFWLRACYFVIIVNAAVIFAGGWRRAIGGVIVLVLAMSWAGRSGVSRSGVSSRSGV